MRSAPVQIARITSFTLVPMAFFSFFTSARLAAAKATRRRACTGALREVRGAAGRPGATSAHLAEARDDLRRLHRRRGPRRSGRTTRFVKSEWETSSKVEGTRRSSCRSPRCSCGGGSGSRSKSAPRSSAPETSSIVAWCILATRAILPSWSPSTTHISHNGRSRCSCRLATSAAKSASSRMPPGEGRAARCTWLSISNSGSSTQAGCPSRRGTSTNRR